MEKFKLNIKREVSRTWRLYRERKWSVCDREESRMTAWFFWLSYLLGNMGKPGEGTDN